MTQMPMLLEASEKLADELDQRIQQKPHSPMVKDRLLQRHKLGLIIETVQCRQNPAEDLKNLHLHRFCGFVLLSAVRLPDDLAKVPQTCKELALLDLEKVGLTAMGVFESDAINGKDFL